MHAADTVQRVRIYLREGDMLAGQPLYQVVLERLERDGATGATAMKGLAGFGARRGLRLTSAGVAPSVPVVIEWVDRAERVVRLLPGLDDLLPEALITVEDLRVHRAVLRSSGPFGERTVGEVAAPVAVTANPAQSVAAALQLLLAHDQPLLPVLAAGRVVRNFLPEHGQQAGVRLPLRLLRLLTPTELEQALLPLGSRTLAELPASELRALSSESPIPLAVRTMVEWNLAGLPVLDRDGQLIGLFGSDQALQAALVARSNPVGAVRDARQPAPLHLLMQRSVPQVVTNTPASTALTQLLASPDRLLVVVEQGRPLGLLHDAELLRQLTGQQRATWLALLNAPLTSLPNSSQPAFAEGTAANLPLLPAQTIDANATQDDASHQLLAAPFDWLIVTDADQKVVGLIGKRTLLRALAQESGE